MTGKGRISVRAESAIEDMPNGRQRIVISELPYGVNNAELVKTVYVFLKTRCNYNYKKENDLMLPRSFSFFINGLVMS